MKRWIAGSIIAVIVLLAGLVIAANALVATDCSNDRGMFARIHTLIIAQKEFRETDADGNGAKDYWRHDISGLYHLKRDGNPLRFIDPILAACDDRPVAPDAAKPAAHGGYWCRALPFEGETMPDPAKWAACAFPESPGISGYWTFIISHDGMTWAKKMAPPPAAFPADPAAAGWLTVEQFNLQRRKDRNPLWFLEMR